MSGEPQPVDQGDKLDRALFGLKTVWFGLFAGGLVITILMVAIVMSGGGGIVDLGALSYVFLIFVPMGLVGAFVLAPMLAKKDPTAVVKRAPQGGRVGFDEWEGTKPDEPYYWFPAYASVFFLRAGMLEGPAIICAVGFFITANWVVLGGSVLMLAALAAQVPTRSAVESFAAAAQARQASGV